MLSSRETPAQEGDGIRIIPSAAGRNLLSREDGSPADCNLVVVEPGGGSTDPGHTHPHDHIFVVIEVRTQIRIGAVSHVLTDCQALHVPGGTPHTLTNIGEKELRLLSVSIPPS